MIAKWLRDDYSDEQLMKAKGQPFKCRFKGHGVFGSIFCTHSDFRGLKCIEDWCLNYIKSEYRKQYMPDGGELRRKREIVRKGTRLEKRVQRRNH